MSRTTELKESINSILSKEIVSVAGRSITVLLLISLLLAGGASAAILNQFGVLQLTGDDIDVEQSIWVGGQALDSDSPPQTVFSASDIEAGEYEFGSISVENRADAVAPISFTSTSNGDYSNDFTGATYKYSLIPANSSASGDAQVRSLQQVAESDLGSVSEGMVTSSEMAVETTVTADNANPQDDRLGDYAGMDFAVSPVAVSADGSGNLDVDFSVDYLVGSSHSSLDQAGDVSSAEAPNTVEFTVENADYTTGGETYESVRLVYRGVETASGNQVTLSDPIVFSEGSQISNSLTDVSSLGSSAQITGVAVRTEDFSDGGETHHIIYESVNFEGSDLISQSTVTVGQGVSNDSGHSETISLEPETKYEFGALMDTSVYLDPDNSTFDIQTALEVPQEIQ